MRSVITSAFRDKKNGQDVHTINRLIIMGRMELEETLMLWKGASHVRAHKTLSSPERKQQCGRAWLPRSAFPTPTPRPPFLGSALNNACCLATSFYRSPTGLSPPSRSRR